ncbi:MAG TPA: GEVED domain-containing protein [Bacteroidia bacterium]|jgi:hypothetical protein
MKHFSYFKTGIFLLLVCCAPALKLNAQVSAYTFSSSAGTYTPITGGTVITSGTSDDNTFGALNIGFPFTYNNIVYNQFGLNVNGWISMGPGVPTSSYTPISGGTTNNIISGLGRDLQLGFNSIGDRVLGSNTITNVTGTDGFMPGDVITATGFPAGTTIVSVGANALTVSNNATSNGTGVSLTVNGEIRYETIGTAPNRVTVIQWTRARRFGTAATTGRNTFYNFQIRLYETTNVVEVVYGTFVTNPTSSTYEIGLRGATNTDFNNRSTTTDWAATTAGATNNATLTMTTAVFPAPGQTYTWTPPLICSGSPVAGSTASSANPACSGVSFTLSLSGTTVASGLNYQWQSSSDGMSYSNIAGATGMTYNATQTATTYYQVIVTCTGSGLSSASTPVHVTMNSFYSCYCAAVNSGSACITNVTINNLNNSTPGCAVNNYSQQSATTNLFLGASYTFSITTDATSITSVWFDWNQNGVFEASEWYQPNTTGTTGSVNVTVPMTAITGLTGMRVRSRSSGNANGANDACTNMGSGETEDYIINVVALPPNPPAPVQDPALPTCSAGTDLSVPGSPAAGDAWYWQTTATGTSLTNPVSGPYTVFLNGTYYVRTFNSTNNVWSSGASSVVVGNIPVAPAPPAPVAAASPACMNTTISVAAPPAGTAYFWQGTNNNGASNAQPAMVPFPVSSSGTYYVAAYDSATSCWSNTSSLPVVINTFIPSPPAVAVDSIIMCQGGPSAVFTATTPSSDSVIVSFGLNLQSPGTPVTFTVTVPSIPAGATITNTQLQIDSAFARTPSYRSEIRVALSGATTLAATQISALTSAGLIAPDPVVTVPNLPLAGGNVTLTLTETLNDGGTTVDATFGEVRLIIRYTIPSSTVSWWDASSGGVQQGTGSPFQAVGTSLLPNTNLPGTYTFYAEANSGSCSSTRVPVSVIINPLPILVLNDTTICSGDPYILNAGNGGSTYLWNTGDVTQTISATIGGLYYVDITTAQGCTIRDSINLIINDPPLVDLGADAAFCEGDSIMLDAANTGFSFLWNDSSTGQTITVGDAGSYYVTVTNPMTSCYASDTIMVTVNPLPLIGFGSDTSFCTGDSVILDAGNPGASYAWSNSAVSQTITVSSPGTYFVFVTDMGTSCYSADTITISQNVLPVVSLGPDTAICNGSTLTLNAGHPGSMYAWSDLSSLQTINVSMAGTYSVLVTDSNGCKGSDSINVSINALPIVDLGLDTVQCAGTVLLDAGNPGLTYMWNNSSSAQTITAITTGAYFVAVTDNNACTAVDSIHVTINPLPVIDLGNDTVMCGGSLVLDAGNPGFMHVWYNNATTQTLTVYASNTISVTVTDPVTGCVNMDTINVIFNQYPVVDLGADISQCAGSVTLDADNAGASFLWNSMASTQTISVSSSGTYTVAVTSNGCTAMDTISVTIHPLPVMGFPAIAAICIQGDPVNLSASPAGGIFTGDSAVAAGAFSPFIAGVGAHAVLYTYTDANNCSNSIMQTINVADCTGIEENENEAGFEVFPNPSSGMISISLVDVSYREMTISVTDLQGKEVFRNSRENISGSLLIPVNLEGFAKGFYYVKLQSDADIKIKKVVIN